MIQLFTQKDIAFNIKSYYKINSYDLNNKNIEFNVILVLAWYVVIQTNSNIRFIIFEHMFNL